MEGGDRVEEAWGSSGWAAKSMAKAGNQNYCWALYSQKVQPRILLDSCAPMPGVLLSSKTLASIGPKIGFTVSKSPPGTGTWQSRTAILAKFLSV